MKKVAQQRNDHDKKSNDDDPATTRPLLNGRNENDIDDDAILRLPNRSSSSTIGDNSNEDDVNAHIDYESSNTNTTNLDSNVNDDDDDDDDDDVVDKQHRDQERGDNDDDDDYANDEEQKRPPKASTATATPPNTATKATKVTAKKQGLVSIKTAMAYNDIMSQRGIVYVARIPPHMTPMKMKQLLSTTLTTTGGNASTMKTPEITRIFCQPDHTYNNKKNTGPKRYIEGWVEFSNKTMAKQIALSYHQQRISNHKRNVHYDDYWCLKYLKQFTWNTLTEKVSYEKRIRDQKRTLESILDQRNIQQYQQLYATNETIQHIQHRVANTSNNNKNKNNQTTTTIVTNKKQKTTVPTRES